MVPGVFFPWVGVASGAPNACRSDHGAGGLFNGPDALPLALLTCSCQLFRMAFFRHPL